MSAALPRIPQIVANDATANGELPDSLRTVFDEITNVGTVMMRRDKKRRIELKDIFGPSGDLPEEVQALLALPGHTFELQVGTYAPGNLKLIFR